MHNTLLVHIDELWTKGKNQKFFWDIIRKQIQWRVSRLHPDAFDCYRESHRIVLHSATPFSDRLIQLVASLPCVHFVFPTLRVPLDAEAAFAAADTLIQRLPALPAHFRVTAKRSNKDFALTSMELAGRTGEYLLTRYPTLRVDLHTPDWTLDLRILTDGIYVSAERIQGPGGLPVGSSGKGVTLLSGGFDSPVASVMMAKRGLQQHFIFFYAYPFVGESVKDKIITLAKKISEFQVESPLHIIPFGKIQEKIAEEVKASYRTLVIRRAMIQCANRLADRIHADVLITGDALGQVSSQTLAAMIVQDKITTRPIFRPLIGFNKQEIIEEAARIGTHDISMIPHDDACALFAPEHPIINPDHAYLDDVSRSLNLDADFEQALTDAQILTDLNPEHITL